MGTVSAPGLLSLPPVLHHYRAVLLPDPALFGCGLWRNVTGTVDCGLRFLGGSFTMLVNPMASGVSWAPEWTFELSRSACEIHGLATLCVFAVVTER